MTPAGRPGARASAGFWQCRDCGTPNPWAPYLTRCLGCGAARPACPTPAGAPGRAPAVQRQRRWVAIGCWAYAAWTLALCALLRGLGDRWWPATFLLYGPRWGWLLPLAVLAPAAALTRPRSLGPVLVAAIIIAGPVMGCCVPWRILLPEQGPEGPGLRILTCNMHGGRLDIEGLATLIDRVRPDVVALQEGRAGLERAIFRGPGWHVRADRGLCLASRYPVRRVELLGDPALPRGWRWLGVRHDLETPGGIVSVCNVHLRTPREGLEAVLSRGRAGIPALQANTALRWRESELASRWVAETRGPVLIAGDFNLPGDSPLYRHCWSGYRDAFAELGLGFGSTKFTRWHGIRIDHILAGPGWRVRRCWVGPDVGSDHLPVVAEVRWIGVSS